MSVTTFEPLVEEPLVGDRYAEDDEDDTEAREEFIGLLKQFLTGKHCTLWGAQFSVWEEQGRQAAAEWIMKLLDDLEAWDPETR